MKKEIITTLLFLKEVYSGITLKEIVQAQNELSFLIIDMVRDFVKGLIEEERESCT